jgi:hypothetical protein
LLLEGVGSVKDVPQALQNAALGGFFVLQAGFEHRFFSFFFSLLFTSCFKSLRIFSL